MASKEEVAILYDKPKQPGDSTDLIKLTKFLNSLSENVSCEIYSTEEFSECAQPLKVCKSVLFLQDEKKTTETVEKVRKKFDAEEGVKLKIITSEAGKTKLAASKGLVNTEDIFTYKKLDNIAEWYPQLLMFLFGRSVEQKPGGKKKVSLFLFDDGNVLELDWFKKTTLVLKQLGKICLWTGDDDTANKSLDDIDCAVVVSKGDGNEMWRQNSTTILQFVTSPRIKVLVFTDKPGSDTVKALKNLDATVYKCKTDLHLSFKKWTSLLQKMSLIECRDVTIPTKAMRILIIVGIVLAAVFLGIPIAIILLAVFLYTGIYFPRLMFKMLGFAGKTYPSG